METGLLVGVAIGGYVMIVAVMRIFGRRAAAYFAGVLLAFVAAGSIMLGVTRDDTFLLVMGIAVVFLAVYMVLVEAKRTQPQ